MPGLSLLDPASLTSICISTPTMLPGDIVELVGGTYSKDYILSIAGTALNPIIIRPYNKERVIIEGSLVVNGSYIYVYNLEFTGRNITSRESEQNGSAPTDLVMTGGVALNGEGNKLINCIIHDCVTNGLSSMVDATIEIYGTLFYYNGWNAPDRGHGHAMYLQSNTKTKLVKDCIFYDQFGWGVHGYTEGGFINNLQVDGCIGFSNGSLSGYYHNNILIGGMVTANNPVIRNCISYGGGGINLGFNAGADNGLLVDNYAEAIAKVNCTNLTESGNTIGVVGDVVFMKPNDYQSDRVNVAIFNESGANNVNVDLTNIDGLNVGDIVSVRNTRDYFLDIQSLTLDEDKKILVNMQAVNRTVSIPIGWDAPSTAFPQFGCFVVEKA